jgi:hypothetical protein
MQGEEQIDIVDDTCRYHRAGTAATFLCWLEHKPQCPAPIARFACGRFRKAEPDCRMPIMSAGMHEIIMLRGKAHAVRPMPIIVRLSQRQSINIKAHRNDWSLS